MRKLGFTLVELLVVMGIVLILAGIGIKSYNGAKQRAKNTQVKASIHTIQVALEEYGIDHSNFYPGLNWQSDGKGNIIDAAPGVLGGVETAPGANDFQNWVEEPAKYILPGQIAMVRWIDPIVAGGYLDKYPANPFLSTGSSERSQMTNLFWYSPDLQSGLFNYNDEQSVDWNKLTNRANGETMKIDYDGMARGHFSYIPLNPDNSQGWDYANDWNTLSGDAISQYYKYCRSYCLIGWGYGREDITVSKGFSSRYFFVDNTDPNNPREGYDIDHNLRIDDFEASLISTSRPEQADSAGTIPTNFGGMVGGNAFRDMDDAFAGATIILTP